MSFSLSGKDMQWVIQIFFMDSCYLLPYIIVLSTLGFNVEYGVYVCSVCCFRNFPLKDCYWQVCTDWTDCGICNARFLFSSFKILTYIMLSYELLFLRNLWTCAGVLQLSGLYRIIVLVYMEFLTYKCFWVICWCFSVSGL